MNEKKTAATLTKDYWKTDFDFANFGKNISTVDASAITRELKITGNDNANQILGGTGDDTLIGGKGNATLQGSDGANLYVYNNGDGSDLIVSWGNRDSISIASGVLSDINIKGDTAILKVGKGKISLQGAAGEQISYWYDGEEYHTIFSSGAYDNVLEDDNFITSDNLSALVQNNSADYSVMHSDNSVLIKNNSLSAITYSGKK